MPWLRSSANKVQTNVFCCCLIVNYGVALHRTCYTIVCRNRHGIFWGLIFGPGIFLGFAGSPRDFFGSWLLAPFDHPRHLKSRVPPLGSLLRNFLVSIEDKVILQSATPQNCTKMLWNPSFCFRNLHIFASDRIKEEGYKKFLFFSKF